ncbi:MAG: fibronectin type III domain-containing protein, partial [bacterium]
PVYLPKVTPPRTPVITKIVGGDRQILIQWAANQEPDLAGYRLYRTADKEKARDMRLMTVAGHASVEDIAFIDKSLTPIERYYYRLTAIDQSSNESIPTEPVVGQAYDDSSVEPPTWSPVIAAIDGSVTLTWVPSLPDLNCRVERSVADQNQWVKVSRWLGPGSNSFVDHTREPNRVYDYRLIAMSPTGSTNKEYLLTRA